MAFLKSSQLSWQWNSGELHKTQHRLSLYITVQAQDSGVTYIASSEQAGNLGLHGGRLTDGYQDAQSRECVLRQWAIQRYKPSHNSCHHHDEWENNTPVKLQNKWPEISLHFTMGCTPTPARPFSHQNCPFPSVDLDFIEYMLPWAHPSPQSKGHLVRFSCFCGTHDRDRQTALLCLYQRAASTNMHCTSMQPKYM